MRYCTLFLTLLTGSLLAQTFDATIKPILKQSCFACHNERMASGGMNVQTLFDATTLASARPSWERIVEKIRTGEMPPQGAPPLAASKQEAAVKFLEAEFDRADRTGKQDPGRVTARRLNRVEYANTIRDLLSVEFSTADEFPPDDSGYGFDNIGDVLTVSPMLMQKYLAAAERIASKAVGGDPLPKPGLFNKRTRVRRPAPGVIEMNDQMDYDAEYSIRALITGHRGIDGKPVTLTISVDGKPVKTAQVETAFTLVNRQGGATQRTFEEVRLFLPQGMHSLRAEFVNDEKPKYAPPPARGGQNLVIETFEIVGPFPAAQESGSRKKLLTCDPASGLACVNRILTPLARRAYRRPVTQAEVTKLMTVHKRALDAGYTPAQSLQFAITAMLVSPQFLFRVEKNPPPGQSAKISDLELATRLSYFLWSSMPDEELLTLAETARLHLPTVLDAQWKRMLASPKALALADNFASQWLETRSLDAAKPDPTKFPAWNNDLKESMRSETKLFFDYVLRENRSVTEFLNANYTFLNEQLAKHYGIEGITGSQFRKVDLTTDQRGGVLTHASVLTVSSYPSRTSVVLRGKYLLDNIFGAPPPAPPADVPAIDEAAVGTTKSLRQQMESHRSNPVCASCHARMDVLGFGLENYDAIGRWRKEDGKFPVDPGGSFPNGKAFTTPAGMKEILAGNMPEFTRCLTEKMLTYALGRGAENFDRSAIREITKKTAESDYRFQTIVAGIVQSYPFQARRGEVPNAKPPLVPVKTPAKTLAKTAAIVNKETK